jgi:hypothetical protein
LVGAGPGLLRVEHHGLVDAASLYKGYRFPVEIISHCVWLYHRFPLSFREVEEMMIDRGDLGVLRDDPHLVPRLRPGVRPGPASPTAPTRG